MEALHAIPDALEFFDFGTRRFVGNARRTIRQIPAQEALKRWELWVAQGLAALLTLHEAGFLHGAIDPSALIITADGNLRLGGLQGVHEAGTVGTVDSFHPNNLHLPPEQLLYAAFRQATPFQTAYQALQQANWPMDQLTSIFPSIQYTRPALFGLYERIQSEPTYLGMLQAGDVWMLGFSLLSVYYELLEWPYAMTTEFYQTKHDTFHDLIETMVRVNPADRVTAREALLVWAPQEIPKTSSPVTTVPQATPVQQVVNNSLTNMATDAITESVGSVSESLPVDAGVATADAMTVADTVAAADLAAAAVFAGGAAAVKPLQGHRPYLTLQSHPAGRNKTRRSPRN